jgi:hypothetical protein
MCNRLCMFTYINDKRNRYALNAAGTELTITRHTATGSLKRLTSHAR